MPRPYDIVKRRYLTEKAAVLEKLKDATSNRSVSRCECPKYTFIVDSDAKKPEIATAIESIYAEKNIKVIAVNTIQVKPKNKNRRGRMNPGKITGFKKAIVTLAAGNVIE
jgi:large subunit ribosomal protein L23